MQHVTSLKVGGEISKVLNRSGHRNLNYVHDELIQHQWEPPKD